MVKNPAANTGDTRDVGLISELGRSPGVGNGNPIQYFCLENSIDRGAWWAIVLGHKESDTTELLSACISVCMNCVCQPGGIAVPGDLFSGAPSPELGRTSGTQLIGQGKTIWTGLCSVADF